MLLQRDSATGAYAAKKILSILRVVLMWSLVVFVAEAFLDVVRGLFGLVSLLDFPFIVIKSLLQKGRLWQFWYLGALMILYALLPLLMRFKNKLKYIWIVCLTVGFVFQIASYVCGEPIQKYFIQTFRLWTWVQYFILGGLLAENKIACQKISERTHGLFLIIFTGIVLVYQNLMGRYVLHNTYAEYFYDDILTVVWVVTLLTFVMRLDLKARTVDVIKQLTPITMGIYIIHPLIRMVGNKVFVIETIPASLLYFAGILVLSAAICFVMKRIPGVSGLLEI